MVWFCIRKLWCAVVCATNIDLFLAIAQKFSIGLRSRITGGATALTSSVVIISFCAKTDLSRQCTWWISLYIKGILPSTICFRCCTILGMDSLRNRKVWCGDHHHIVCILWAIELTTNNTSQIYYSTISLAVLAAFSFFPELVYRAESILLISHFAHLRLLYFHLQISPY